MTDLLARYLADSAGALSKYLMAAGALSMGIMLIKQLGGKARKIRSQGPSMRQVAFELASSVRSVAVFVACAYAIEFVGGLAGLKFKIVRDTPSAWLTVLSLLALIVLHDFYFYWTHRAMHTRLLFQRMHAHHHRSVIPTVWSAYSFSMSEALVHGAFLPLYLLVFPATVVSITAFLSFQIIYNALGHSGHELLPKHFVRIGKVPFLTSPTHHDMHHGTARYNFGLYLRAWDRFQGTEHPHYEAHYEALRAGAAPFTRFHSPNAPFDPPFESERASGARQ